jgi:predicted metal-binding membrane protein
MADAALEMVLRRDRIIVAAALAVLAALAWSYLYLLCLAAAMDVLRRHQPGIWPSNLSRRLR